MCDGCDRTFTTVDGPGMLKALKGPCPDCGGRFQLVGKVGLDDPGSPIAEKAQGIHEEGYQQPS